MYVILFHFLRAWSQLGGSGSILSNAVDMANWLNFLLGKYNTSFTNSSDTWSKVLKETWTPLQVIKEDATTSKYHKPNCPVSYIFNQYALGWRTGFYRG